jgi:hypothetical protein
LPLWQVFFAALCHFSNKNRLERSLKSEDCQRVLRK